MTLRKIAPPRIIDIPTQHGWHHLNRRPTLKIGRLILAFALGYIIAALVSPC